MNMSYKGANTRTSKIGKDLKTHLLQSLQNNSVFSGKPDKYPSDHPAEDDHFVNSGYPPSGATPGIKDLQSKMTPGCQELVPSQCPQDTDMTEEDIAAQYPTLSHKQLVESLDRLSTPPPSQLTQVWVRQNEGTQEMCGEEQVYGEECWDDRLHPGEEGNLDIQQQQQLPSLDGSQQPGADILMQIERSLHEHIDDELNSLRANLHDLVADQQVHLRHYLTPTHYSQDVDDIDIISNQEDFNGTQEAANLEDTGWSSDCMQSSCSTVNEPMKLEEASPDSAVILQDDVITCQQESVAIINRLTEENEIQASLIQLQTSAGILSHTLRRQEYSTT